MVWLPRTAVGEGDEPGADADALLDDAGDVDGDPDCAAEREGDAVTVDGVTDVVADGDALCVTVADGFAELGEELGLAWLAAGLRAIDPVDDAAKTAAPSATRPRIATIGTSPIRRPRGRNVRQLGQNPETGVKW